MKHAVVIAHPDGRSLTHSAANAYLEAARGLRHEVVVRDLYAMDFDPRLQAAEIPGRTPPTPAADVVAERALLAGVDVFAFVYPFWFNAPPAILKGYVDRVFCMGFGFAPGPGCNEPLLEGRSLISFSFSGAPEQWVQDTGALPALKTLFDRHLAQMCGLVVLDHIHTGGIPQNMTEDAGDAVLATVREAVARQFGPDASRAEDLG
jgi:NAD(P)H dehydrogenase (quinone)